MQTMIECASNVEASVLERVIDLINDRPKVLGELFDIRDIHPPGTFQFSEDELDALKESGLIQLGGARIEPAYRLARECAGALVTRDFPRTLRKDEAARGEDRVFPWRDESDAIFDYVTRIYQDKEPPRSVLNLCSGSGAILFSLARHWENRDVHDRKLVGIDKNPRAIEISRFNKQLNIADGQESAHSIDFRLGNLFDQLRRGERFDLVIADAPYSFHPPSHNESGFHGGGTRGVDVVEPILKRFQEFLNSDGRLICPAYSLGTKSAPTHVRSIFASAVGMQYSSADEQSVSECVFTPSDPYWQRLWRFRDVKCLKNPCPLEYLSIRLADHSFPFYKQAEQDPLSAIERYVYDWIETLKKEKDRFNQCFSHLHYVMIDYSRTGSRSIKGSATRRTKVESADPLKSR